IERGQRAGSDPTQVVESLRPAVEHLIHLWLPGARVEEAILPIWEGFERRPGFSRQWQVSVNRVRDQIAVRTARLLGSVSAVRWAGANRTSLFCPGPAAPAGDVIPVATCR